MNPTGIGLHTVRPEVYRKLGLDAQEIAPFHCPVVGKLLPLHQVVDEITAFVGIVAVKKVADLPRLRPLFLPMAR